MLDGRQRDRDHHAVEHHQQIGGTQQRECGGPTPAGRRHGLLVPRHAEGKRISTSGRARGGVHGADVRWVTVRLGIIVLLCAVALGALLSLLKSQYDGRFRGTRQIKGTTVLEATDVPAPEEAERLTAADLGAALGERATLLQFSSAFCAPCRATRRILAEVAGMVDGVRHIEVDAEAELGLVRRLGILRTPTVLVLDGTGTIVTRASGQPRKPDVIAAIGKAVDHQRR
jgi:thiol-disulfide isomerase/thioredoxin